MKHICVTIPVFETGDRVSTSEGLATVIHDEMEDFDISWRENLSARLQASKSAVGVALTEEFEGWAKDAFQASLMRQGVIMRLDAPTSKHPNVEEDFVDGRDYLILVDKS